MFATSWSEEEEELLPLLPLPLIVAGST